MKHTKTGTKRSAGRMRRRLTIVSLLAIALLTIGVVVALSRQPNNDLKPASERNYRPRPLPQKIGFDTQTGQVRPLTQEEAKQLADELKRLANQSTEGLNSVHHADGTVSKNLEGRFQNVALAKRNPDGSINRACVNNPAAGAEFLGIDPALVGAPRKTDTNSPSSNAAQK